MTRLHADFFVLRSPLLPLPAPPAWAEDTPVVQRREEGLHAMRALLADPVVREALWLNSPELDRAVGLWLDDPSHPHARKVPLSLYRYLNRMRTRSTPFGLNAGSATGAPAAETRLERAGTPRTHTRPDMAWLAALLAAVEPELRESLAYRPNTSLLGSAGQLRYAEARVDPRTRARRNDRVALTRTPAIDAVLAAAPGTPGTLAHAVVALHPEVDPQEARDFVDGLIAARVLVPVAEPPITGPDAFAALLAGLGEGPVVDALREAHAAFLALDDAPLGERPYAALLERLAQLPAPPDARSLFHVDLYLAGEFTLGPRVVEEVRAAAALLQSLMPNAEQGALVRLARDFERRWGDAVVPLAEVLDEERGVGFGSEGLGADPSPLLDGLDLSPRAGAARAAFGARERWMLRRVQAVGPGGVWSLDAEDLRRLRVAEPRPLPDSVAFVGALEAEDAAAVDEGRFALRVVGFTGPSAARLFGRFCLGDPQLRARVEDHLRAEEALAPDAVFAEIVHSPADRAGNVLGRPRLRTHEIPYLGSGAAPPSAQIPVDDLLLGFVDGQPRLWSRRLGREVLPRLSSAHTWGEAELPIYRFLGAMQAVGVNQALAWSWGALGGLAALPRVCHGRLILAPATWNLEAEDLAPLVGAGGEERLRAARALRARWAMPRQVELAEEDNLLRLDLEDPLALDVLAARASGASRVTLQEAPAGPSPCVGPAPFAHELVVALRREGPPRPPCPPPATGHAPRAWMPGSPWLYAKLFTGTVTADALLVEVVAPLVAELRADGLLERWFFLRYGDPDWHLRLRLRGPKPAVVLERLHAALAPWQADGRLARLELDTYLPELQRYGGDAGIGPSEALFEADSDVVLAALPQLCGDEDADLRWRLGLLGAHLWLEDFAIPLPERIRMLQSWRQGYTARLGLGPAFERGLNERFRVEARALDALLDDPSARSVFAARSAAAALPLAALRSAGLSTEPLVASHVHMAMNRLFRARNNEVELVLYELLARVYKSRLARAR